MMQVVKKLQIVLLRVHLQGHCMKNVIPGVRTNDKDTCTMPDLPADDRVIGVPADDRVHHAWHTS